MTRVSIYFDGVQEGQALPPPPPFSVDRARVAAWADLTRDPNPLHFDEAYAKRIGFPSICVPSALVMGRVGEWISAWAHPGGVKRLVARDRRLMWPDEPLTVAGRVVTKRVEAETCYVDIAVEVHNPAGDLVLAAEATVWLHRNMQEEDRRARGLASGLDTNPSHALLDALDSPFSR